MYQSDRKISTQEALAHLLDTNMTKIDYDKNCKLVNKSRRILPPYYHLEAEKLKCRPPGISANSHEVVVPLQNLLDHTVSRLLEDEVTQQQIERLSDLNGGNPLLLEFIWKFGFDGSGGLGKFKQLTDEHHVPGKLFASNLVPLQIVTYVGQKIHVIYHNCLCNSPKAVRPIRHNYVNETIEIIRQEDERLESEIRSLVQFEWTEDIKVGYIGIKSMCDQKA